MSIQYEGVDSQGNDVYVLIENGKSESKRKQKCKIVKKLNNRSYAYFS